MENHFQVAILGTGLTESITAAGLAKAGYSVAHLDPNPYYGADEASLTPEELRTWASERSSPDPTSSYRTAQQARYTSISVPSTFPDKARQYALSLAPSVIPAVGPLISALVGSGVARYGGYKLVDKIGVYEDGNIRQVPGGKEDVFRSREMSLVEKRRLMRFLMFAAGEFESAPEVVGKEEMSFVQFLRSAFSLPEKVSNALAYALAFCHTASDPTLPALKRIHTALRSAGRYGPSPFLIGHYGGSGEIAQGFCRTAAVQGGVYILGRQILSVSPHPPVSTHGQDPPLGRFSINVEGVPDTLTTDIVIAAEDHVDGPLAACVKPLADKANTGGHVAVARGIAILDRPVLFARPEPQTEVSSEEQEQQSGEVDTGIIVFPPGSLHGGSDEVAVTALVTGEASMSTPHGKWVAYLSMPLLGRSEASAQSLLKPYLNAILALTGSPVTESTGDAHTEVLPETHAYYYTKRLTPSQSTRSVDHQDGDHAADLPTVFTVPIVTDGLAESSDLSATHAEALFWAASKVLKAQGVQPVRGGEEGDASEAGDVTRFWPPLESVGDEDDAW